MEGSKEEEDARLLDRGEAKRKERSKHWQCDEEVQNVQDKPWRNDELEEASRMYKAKTGEEQRQKIKERSLWFWTWRSPLSESASLRSGPGRRTAASQGRSCWCFCEHFEHQRRVQFERCAAEPSQTITVIVPGSKWSCLLLCCRMR